MTRLAYAISGAAALFLALQPAARADTIYDFTALVSNGQNGFDPAVSFQLDLADNFTGGTFSRSCAMSGCTSSGDFSGFSLSFTSGGRLLGVLDAQPDTIFEDTQGVIYGDSGSLFWGTSQNTVSLAFGGGTWNAVVDSDDFPTSIPNPCPALGCTASGTLAEVPEPSTLGIFPLAVLALVASWRLAGFGWGRRKASSAGT